MLCSLPLYHLLTACRCIVCLHHLALLPLVLVLPPCCCCLTHLLTANHLHHKLGINASSLAALAACLSLDALTTMACTNLIPYHLTYITVRLFINMESILSCLALSLNTYHLISVLTSCHLIISAAFHLLLVLLLALLSLIQPCILSLI